jgi:hypothetical protein
MSVLLLSSSKISTRKLEKLKGFAPLPHEKWATYYSIHSNAANHPELLNSVLPFWYIMGIRKFFAIAKLVDRQQKEAVSCIHEENSNCNITSKIYHVNSFSITHVAFLHCQSKFNCKICWS